MDNGDGRADRHAEQRQNFRLAGGREQHDNADDGGVQKQHDGRIDGVIKVRPLHGGVALADAPVVPALHVALQAERADRADVVQRFWHLPGNGGDGAAVIKLCCEHPLLHMAREHGKERQHQQQDESETGVFYRDDGQDRNYAAGIRHHADDSGGEKCLHSVHIAGKARGHLAGVLPRERAGGQKRQLPGHFRAQRVGHLLAEQHEKALLRAGEKALQRETAEIEQHRERGERHAAGQPVNDAPEQQRREERRANARRHAEKSTRGEKRPCRGSRPDRGEHAAILLCLHALSLLSGFRRAGGTPERTPSAPRVCRRPFSRPP